LDDYSAGLLSAVDAAVPGWIERSVASVLAAQGLEVTAEIAERARAAGQLARTDIETNLRALLSADVDEQRTTPLAVVRAAVSHATEVLAAAGATPVRRGEFDVRAFPEDLFALAPASWAAVDPELVTPGLIWGAWKAKQHLARHRPRPPVLAFVPDLMDRSRLANVTDDLVFVTTRDELLRRASEARLILVDLGRIGSLDDFAPDVPVLAFGPHEDRDRFEAARARGFTVMARSRFFADPGEALAAH
jgi:hypothetical protein